MKNVSPLLGFNNNIRYRGKMFHVQTEDSGVKHPHVITHLFTDGGRIIKTAKTSYADHLGREDLNAHVKRLMMDQHKAMFIALKEGQFDSVIVALAGGPHVSEVASSLKETKEGSAAPRISAGLAAAAAAAAGRSSMHAATPVEPDEPPMPLPSGSVPLIDPAPPTPVVAATQAEPIEAQKSPPPPATVPRFTSPLRPNVAPPPPVTPAVASPVQIPRPGRSTHATPAGSPRVSPPAVPVAPQAAAPAPPLVAPPPPPPPSVPVQFTEAVRASTPAAPSPSGPVAPTPVPPAGERNDTTYRTVLTPGEREKPRPASGRHAVSRPASIFASSKPSPQNASIFGEERISDKSLDEVILTYLAEDLDTPPPKK